MPKKSSMTRTASKTPSQPKKPKQQWDTVAPMPRKKAIPIPTVKTSNATPLLSATPKGHPYINQNKKIRKKYMDKITKTI